MVLNNHENYRKIAEYFNYKFTVVAYVGVWHTNTITFALWQDKSEQAGIELTIEAPKGDMLETVKVIRVRRIPRFAYNERRQIYERSMLPILICDKNALLKA